MGFIYGPMSHMGRFNFALSGTNLYVSHRWRIWVHDYLFQDQLQKDAHIWVSPDITYIPLFAVITWYPSGSNMATPI